MLWLLLLATVLSIGLCCEKMEHKVILSNSCSAYTQSVLHVGRRATSLVTRQCQVAKPHRCVQGLRNSVDSRALASSSTGSAEQKIRIKLKAFELPLLQESVSHILQAAESTGQACASVPHSLYGNIGHMPGI